MAIAPAAHAVVTALHSPSAENRIATWAAGAFGMSIGSE